MFNTALFSAYLSTWTILWYWSPVTDLSNLVVDLIWWKRTLQCEIKTCKYSDNIRGKKLRSWIKKNKILDYMTICITHARNIKTWPWPLGLRDSFLVISRCRTDSVDAKIDGRNGRTNKFFMLNLIFGYRIVLLCHHGNDKRDKLLTSTARSEMEIRMITFKAWMPSFLNQRPQNSSLRVRNPVDCFFMKTIIF